MRFPAILTAAAVMALFALTGSRVPDTAEVTLTLTEAGRPVSGMVKITDAAGKTVKPPELFSRGKGLSDKLPIDDWYIVPEKTKLRLPRGKLTIQAFSGLETETSRTTVDIGTTTAIDIPLTRFSDSRKQGLRSANTHLHLQKISRQECDRYLTEIPKADDLDVLFLSYLERAVADKQYTSNRYNTADLAKLTKSSGVLFGNGEEHRHNFAGFGQGYGHVMLLDIKKLIQPVSIGPGIMKIGTDGLPLQRGIDTARRDGATVVWCHNDWGMEQVPNWVTGRVNAHNIFDGGTHGSFKNSFYRYLNAGIRVPLSTGTDWFMYDFSRVYVPVEGKLTVKKWLAALSAGKSYVTNGPLMEFTVNGKSIGETVALKQTGKVNVVGKIVGRIDFGRAEESRRTLRSDDPTQ